MLGGFFSFVILFAYFSALIKELFVIFILKKKSDLLFIAVF